MTFCRPETVPKLSIEPLLEQGWDDVGWEWGVEKEDGKGLDSCLPHLGLCVCLQNTHATTNTRSVQSPTHPEWFQF